MKRDYYVEDGSIFSVPKGQSISLYESIFCFGPFRSKLFAYSWAKKHLWLNN